MPKPKGSERKHKNTLAAFRKNKGNKLKPTHVALAQYMRPVSSVDIERCIARGTRTSVACTRHQRGEYQWKHKYMLHGVHVVVEPWTDPPLVIAAYRVVNAWF